MTTDEKIEEIKEVYCYANGDIGSHTVEMALKESILYGRSSTLAEVERHVEEKMIAMHKSSRENLDKNLVMLAYDMDSRYVAMKHFREFISSKRGELEK